ncbi:MAG TPA: COX aromatic rich motif-containing protein [Verrucomicrobiae bacterium]|nr:COX aromatic rich motif-containing protein [Verrucomicrobiae bacterium]
MKKYKKVLGILLVTAVIVVATGWYLSGHVVSVLQPAGPVSHKERNLIVFTLLLSAVVVIPVFTMLGVFAYRYREGNRRAKYDPKLEGNALAETIWWLIPAVIVGVIGVVTWRSSYAMDPFKALGSKKQTLNVQVVSLDWKWLFIYPGQDVASVNEAAVPVGTPVNFELTSDTVMTSFWVPQLGGQMYAMPGMATQLNLEADKTGSFNGFTANISGSGFAGMTFAVKSMSQSSFNSWVTSAKHTKRALNASSYEALAQPSSYVRPSYYATVDPNLYDTIVMKYMTPQNGGDSVDTVSTTGVKS